MSRITYAKAIELADAYCDNEMSTAWKLDVLYNFELQLMSEVMMLSQEEIDLVTEPTPETAATEELEVPRPHAQIYPLRLACALFEVNREYAELANMTDHFNAAYVAFVQWWAKTYKPKSGEAGFKGYYLSAYAIAQKHGYTGTEAEWLASLKGDKGDKGDTGAQGEKGEKGDPGTDGVDGYTPLRGVDYWNADDQNDIIERTKRAVLSDTVTVNIAEGSQIDFKSAKETDITGLRIYGADGVENSVPLIIAGKNKFDQSAVSLYLLGTTIADGTITTRVLNAYDEDNYDAVPSIPNTNFLKAGKYVLSFKARLESGTYSNNLYGVYLYYNDSGIRVRIGGTAILNPKISEVYQTFAFGIELPTDSFIGWGFSVKSDAEAAIFEVTDVQIEQGDSCTEYSLPSSAFVVDISPYTLGAGEYLYYDESWKIISQTEKHLLGDSAQIVLNSARIHAGDNLIYLRGTQPESLRLIEKIEEKVRHRIFFRKTLDDVFVFSKYNAQNDLCVRWKKKGGNNLFDIYQIIKIPNSSDRVSTSTEGGTVMITTETDWHAPYRMRATENGNGSTSFNFTGGAHDSTGGGSGGVPTAATVSLIMEADGFRLGDVEIGWCDELVFQWENQVQGYNTGEAEGFSPRYILRELHRSVFDGRIWKQEAHIIPLENIYVIEYYGLQNSGSGYWNNYAYFVGSTGNRGINDLSQAVNSGDKVAQELIRWGEEDEMVMGIDTSYDIGDRSLYGGDGDTLKAIFTNNTTGKAYFNLIVSQKLSNSSMYSFKGYYIFRPRRI